MAPSPIDRILDEAVASGTAPGVVALAADANGVFYEGARGRTGPDARRRSRSTRCSGSRR